MPVIEVLTFEVEPDRRDEWLDVEASTWTRFLERQAGFLRKEVWVERDRPEVVHAMIWWADEASWKAIPEDQLRAVDEAMGPWYRTSTCRVFDLVRDS